VGIKQAVRERYGKIAAAGRTAGACCTPGTCMGETSPPAACGGKSSGDLGYSPAELAALLEGADLTRRADDTDSHPRIPSQSHFFLIMMSRSSLAVTLVL